MGISVDIGGPGNRKLLKSHNGARPVLLLEHSYIKDVFGDLLADVQLQTDGETIHALTYSLSRGGQDVLSPETPQLGVRSGIATEDWERLRRAYDTLRERIASTGNENARAILSSFMAPRPEDLFAFRIYGDPVTGRNRLVILWGTLPSDTPEHALIAPVDKTEEEWQLLSTLAGPWAWLRQSPWARRGLWIGAGVICLLLLLMFIRSFDVAEEDRIPDRFVDETPAPSETVGDPVDESLATTESGGVVGFARRFVFGDEVGDTLESVNVDSLVVSDTLVVVEDMFVRSNGSNVDSVSAWEATEVHGGGTDLADERTLAEDPTQVDDSVSVDDPALSDDQALPGDSALNGEDLWVRLDRNAVARISLTHPVRIEYLEGASIDGSVRAQVERTAAQSAGRPRRPSGYRAIWLPENERLYRSIDPASLTGEASPSSRPGSPAVGGSYYILLVDGQGRYLATLPKEHR